MGCSVILLALGIDSYINGCHLDRVDKGAAKVGQWVSRIPIRTGLVFPTKVVCCSESCAVLKGELLTDIIHNPYIISSPYIHCILDYSRILCVMGILSIFS